MNLYINNYNFIPDKKRTGEVINQIRKDNNLKIAEFAEILSVDEKTVSKWISGYSFPNITTLDYIRQRFNTTLDYLLLPDSNIDISIYNYFNSDNRIFKQLELKPIDNFDDQGFALNYIELEEAYKELIKYKNKVLLSDYFTQKHLFSNLNSKDWIIVDNLKIELMSEQDKNELYLKYGYSYKLNINQNNKNKILFDSKKRLYSPVFDEKTKLDKYNSRASYLINFVYYLFFSDDKKYHELLIDTLDDFEAEIVYNSLKRIVIKDDYDFLVLLEKRNVQRYKNLSLYIDCSIEHMSDFFLRTSGENVEEEKTCLFRKNRAVPSLSVSCYQMYIIAIFNLIIENTYEDYITMLKGDDSNE